MLIKPLTTKFKLLKYISDFKSPRTQNHQQDLIFITIYIPPSLKVLCYICNFVLMWLTSEEKDVKALRPSHIYGKQSFEFYL